MTSRKTPAPEKTPRTAYLGLGCNLGDRPAKAATLVAAAKMIDKIDGTSVARLSNFIETQPVGGPPDQPNYLNAAARIETTLEPQDLLAALQDVERRLGRDRSREQRWGPRACDLDILLMGDRVVNTDTLTIPHPRLHERAFALRPLAEIAPDALHPVLGKTVAQLLAELECK